MLGVIHQSFIPGANLDDVARHPLRQTPPQ
jgi:hypothetical protein